MSATDGIGTARFDRLTGALRTMVRVRWVAVVFCLVQIFTFYAPYPESILGIALGFTILLVSGNVAAAVALPRVTTIRAARILAVLTLALDVVVVLGLVGVYTFDPDVAMFAIVYLLPLEAAILFQLRGALLTMGGATVLYIVREVIGDTVYGHELLLTSISFRMGIGWLIALVAGAMASNLVRERDRLAAANAELQLANEVKDDFVAMTNHELRTPLTTILGYTSTLSRRWDDVDEERKRDFLGQIDAQGRRLLALVEGLLTISSAQAGALRINLQPVPLRPAVDTALQGFSDLETRIDCPAGLSALADPARLHQVLVNLMANARKYGAPPVEIQATAHGDEVLVRIRDHGSGVPEDFVPRMFDKFSQASRGDNRSAEGTGLGLAIVRQLVEAQGGRVDYEAPPDGGASFCVRLPALPPDEDLRVEGGQAHSAPH